jgi:hypothetical protein
MSCVGKTRALSRRGDSRTSHQVARGPLQPEPENIRPQGNTDRLGENVHETPWRQTRYTRKRLQGKIVRNPKPLSEILEHTINSGMNLGCAAPMQQFFPYPLLDPYLSERASQGRTPACNLSRWNTRNIVVDLFTEGRPQLAL